MRRRDRGRERRSVAELALARVPAAGSHGELLKIPPWIQDLSPFEHLALVPAQDVDWAAVFAVGTVAVVLSVAGQYAFRRRDVH